MRVLPFPGGIIIESFQWLVKHELIYIYAYK